MHQRKRMSVWKQQVSSRIYKDFRMGMPWNVRERSGMAVQQVSIGNRQRAPKKDRTPDNDAEKTRLGHSLDKTSNIRSLA